MAKFCVLIPFADAAQLAEDVRVSSLESPTLTDWHCFLLPTGPSASGTPILKSDRFDVGPDRFPPALEH